MNLPRDGSADPGGPAKKRLGFHRDSGRVNLELEVPAGAPTPRLSVKCAYYFSDLAAQTAGQTWVIPGRCVTTAACFLTPHRSTRGAEFRPCLQPQMGPGRADAPEPRVREDAKLAQKLGQLQPFIAVSAQECTGQLASSGPT
jgi:hypothetical protein